MLKLRLLPLAALWLAAFPVAATAATFDVSVIDNRFSPNDITINVGDTVRWTNASGGAPHTVTADDGSFTSIQASSFTFSRTFNSVEEVLYYCQVHSSPGRNRSSNMNGRVTVVAQALVPPTADFTSSCTDLACNFTDQSSDSDGTIASRSWDFGDGVMSSAQNPGHTYGAAGTFSVSLDVTDNDGQTDSTSKNVTVTAAANQAPNAAFSASCTNLDCNFTDQSTDSDGSIASRSWDFGDGTMSTMQNPAHSYAGAGTFAVKLTATDNDGATDSTLKSVTVTAAADPPFLINTAISDAWFFPDTNGQGFFIIVWEASKFVFLSWFTYDTQRPPADVMAMLGEPGHRWLTAQGPFDGDTATLDVFVSSGGTFDSPDPEVTAVQDGTITIKWWGCNAGILTYDIPSLGLMGEIPIERIVLDNVPACEAAQP